MSFTQAGEKTAMQCLTVHEWKLDVAVDNYFQVPERYNRETKPTLDRRKIEQLFGKYRGHYLEVKMGVLIMAVISNPRDSNCPK
jgi:DCN1-like protein 1/2